MPGMLDRPRFWVRALSRGAASLNTLAGWFSLVVLLLGVAAGIAVPLVFHVSHWVTAVIIMAAALVAVLEGSYLEWKDADKGRREAESTLEGARTELEAARGLAVNAPTAVNPAEWKAVCNESGEFPDSKALTFGLDHRFDHRGAFLAFGALRCTVTDPAGITTSATGQGRYYQYTEPFFETAPPVRPGLYRFGFEGQISTGRWVDIASNEHEVQPPPKTGLEVVIDNEIPTPFPGLAVILEIEYHVTNHDHVPHQLRPALRGVEVAPRAQTDTAEYAQVLQAYGVFSERRRRDGLPNRVQPGETIRGVYLHTFAWDPSGRIPDYTLIIRDERQAYTARPHGAAEDPLAAWPVS